MYETKHRSIQIPSNFHHYNKIKSIKKIKLINFKETRKISLYNFYDSYYIYLILKKSWKLAAKYFVSYYFILLNTCIHAYTFTCICKCIWFLTEWKFEAGNFLCEEERNKNRIPLHLGLWLLCTVALMFSKKRVKMMSSYCYY